MITTRTTDRSGEGSSTQTNRTYEWLVPGDQIHASYFGIVETFLDLIHGWSIGWHYVIDLAWIYSIAADWEPGARILDVGGGAGPTQYLLLELGFDVTNIDLAPPSPTRQQRNRYRTKEVESSGFEPTEYLDHLDAVTRYAGSLRPIAKYAQRKISRRPRYDTWRDRWPDAVCDRIGQHTLVKGNATKMPEFDDDHFDAVVSLSSLEHVPIDQLSPMVAEIDRVVRRGGRWAVTTSGTDRVETWYHEQSQGLCFNVADLSNLVLAEPKSSLRAADTLELYRACEYLQRRLAPFYSRSDSNGMPWGHWDPVYIPIGISQ